MAISPGQTIVVSDFPQSSAGAADSGKGVRLNTLGLLDYTFLDNEELELLTAGESATPGQTATIGDGGNVAGSSGGSVGSNDGFSTTTWLSQNFATTSKILTLYSFSLNFGSSGHSITASVHAIDGSNKPTGAALGTVNISSNSTGINEFVFASPITLSASTTYAIVVRTTASTDQLVRGSTNNSGGTSSDSGATWSMTTGNYQYSTKEIQTIAGRVYKGDADRNGSSTSSFSDRFIGIFETTGSAASTCLVKIGKVSRKVTGLTTGALCYISDTEGGISHTAGTLSRKIGIALSATSMLITRDNP